MKRTAVLAAGLAAGLQAAAPAGAKTLVYCSEGTPESLNPQLVTTTTGLNAARQMFNNLVEFIPGTTTLRPALADSWTISPDGTEYTFHLRDNVRFQSNDIFTPTRPLNSDDVLFSLERQWKEDHPYHGVSGGRFDYFKDMGMPDLLKSIEKIDDRTVRITLARPEAPFLANLAMPFNAILSAEYAAQLLEAGTPELLDEKPLGTGPFVFRGFQKDVAVRYGAFDDYWEGRRPLDTLVFSITPNAAVRLTKLKAGECHVMAFPNPADIGRIAEDPSLRLLQQEGLNIGYLALNTQKPPFDDVRVRHAINMAIDKQAIIDAVYGGAGVVAKNPIPPTLWSYNDDIEDFPYDIAAAQQLLAEAGYPQGFESDLWYMPVSRPYNPDARRIAEMIASDLARIGIRLELVTQEWSDYRISLQNGEHAMALYGWTGDNGDPDNFLHVLLGCTAARIGGNNVARWCDPEFDALVNAAKLTSDQEERTALYRKAQEIFKRESPWVPLAHSVVFMAERKEVEGFRMDPLGRQPFDGVDLKP
ncbi:dipeptide transport system substrate-binding protein [Tepidamorphus gemmatus]|uniref:Dipeptide transport system substrate-binding protein n=1 Tax=Tepidamorphus gemmatus TaxID=747076 RepID=A0A4R3MAV0_9HYPH|nr:ABC transporter substrate-binding protein [Tepidamorphus gemmatus]TCT10630.1 dipeptide transport system substrate-binding protein [Tepidamorphus gemmatus]